MNLWQWLRRRWGAKSWRNVWHTSPYQMLTLSNAVAGLRVTHDGAMKFPAVYACVRLLAETVGSLPLKVYRRLDGGGKREARDHWLWPLLHDSPNSWQTALEWKEMMQGHLALRGNAYSEILWRNGEVLSFVPLHPDRVTPERLEDGSLRYVLRRPEEDYQERRILQENMLHLRGLSSDGIVGLSPIAIAADAIAVCLATQQHAGSFWGNGAHLGAVLKHPNTLSQPARDNLNRSLREEYGGPGNAHKTMVLEEGMDWVQVGVKPEEAQFLETRKLEVNEIARIFRVPPHMIGDLERATFSNIEHQGIDFVMHTMRPWVMRWEQAINKSLLWNWGEQDVFVEYVIDALLRGDTQSRYESYKIGVDGGWITRNEVREKENMNPLPGLDEPLQPLNMGSSGNNEEPPAEALGYLLRDAAVKIANREEREFKDTDKWREGHVKYIIGALTPIATAFERGINALAINTHVHGIAGSDFDGDEHNTRPGNYRRAERMCERALGLSEVDGEDGVGDSAGGPATIACGGSTGTETCDDVSDGS